MPAARVYDHHHQTFLYLRKISGADKYVNHLVTGYTAHDESGSAAGHPKLTLHLKSPAVQEAEAAALQIEEEATGWITHDCHQVLDHMTVNDAVHTLHCL